MATTLNPPVAPGPKKNRLGLQVLDYRGGKTTLCAGCGHNAISERIVDAMYEMGVAPERVMKLSGIGCSLGSAATGTRHRSVSASLRMSCGATSRSSTSLRTMVFTA